MSEKKKKIFPKLQKKLKDFLTDESGEITKKDALGVAAGAALLASVESVSADTVQSKRIPTWYSSPGGDTVTANGYCTVNVTAKHVSGIVNGHISQNPELNVNLNGGITHASHSSHSSGGWC